MRELHLHLVPNHMFNKFLRLEKEIGHSLSEVYSKYDEYIFITRSDSTVLRTEMTRLLCLLSDLLFLAISSGFIPSIDWKNLMTLVLLCLCLMAYIILPWSLRWTKNHYISRTLWTFENLAMSSKYKYSQKYFAFPTSDVWNIYTCEDSSFSMPLIVSYETKSVSSWYGMKQKLTMEIPLDIRSCLETSPTWSHGFILK